MTQLPRLLDRLDQLRLLHFAAIGNAKLFGLVVKLVARALFERRIRVAGALGALVRCATSFAAGFVHSAGGDLLGTILVGATIEGTVFDVLVLALVFVAPCCWHDRPPP